MPKNEGGGKGERQQRCCESEMRGRMDRQGAEDREERGTEGETVRRNEEVIV